MRILVTKASGEREPFMPEKIARTLTRAGIPNKAQRDILSEIEKHIYDGISTQEIYQRILRALSLYEVSRGFARYNLKQAIMQLGPTGFPFERFIGEVLKRDGFEISLEMIVQGQCIQHEVDIVAQKDNKHFMVECKYHSNPGVKTDAKVALYIWGRFLDIEKAWQTQKGHAHKFHQAWLVTNTKCTTDAIRFCA